MRIVLAGQGLLGDALSRGLGPRHTLVGRLFDGRKPLARRLLQPWLPAALARGLPLISLHPGAPADALARLRPDLLLCGDFGARVPDDWLAVPRLGGVNAHWSLLPHHRGPDPAGAAIRAGAPRSGISFHVMERRFDAGALLLQRAFDLGPRDTALSIYARAATLAAESIAELLDQLDADGVHGTPLDLATGSYQRRPRLSELQLDLSQPAEDLDRLVRSCSSPMAWLQHHDQRVHVSRTRLGPASDKHHGTVLSYHPLRVATGRDSLILDACYSSSPPWIWPPPWAPLRPGQRLG